MSEDTAIISLESHFKYLDQLSKSALDLIVERHERLGGSWDKVAICYPSQKETIQKLRDYEKRNELNLYTILTIKSHRGRKVQYDSSEFKAHA